MSRPTARSLRWATRSIAAPLWILTAVTLGSVQDGFERNLHAADDPPAATQASSAERSIENWEGSLNVGAVRLRLVLKVKRGAEDSLSATLDSIDQGAKDIPVDSITIKDGRLMFAMKLLQAEFTGTLSEAGDEAAGDFVQAGNKLPLTFKKVEKPSELRRPQEPQPPLPYREEEVSYEGAAAGAKIAGTLTLPEGAGPFPAVLLITGSGSQDRNETVAGHRPFLVLADDLTRRGIAVLRVDDRGVGGSTGDPLSATSLDLAEDALQGVKFLRGRRDIDGARIGLVGHSEGGLIAPIAASRSSDVAFIVLLAGPGVTGEEILYAQGDLIGRAASAPQADLDRQRALQQRMFQIVRETPDADEAEQKLLSAIDEEIAKLPGAEKQKAEEQRSLAEAQAKQLVGPWFRFFLTYDPRPTLRKVKCPVLAVIGEKDLQVPAQVNLRELEGALVDGGNPDYEVLELPGLNHLLQTAETGSPAEYSSIEETINPTALQVIGEWIVKHTGG
jgi:uncharacterized protein